MKKSTPPMPLEIVVFCTVVDNFGDIGVAWRLCQGLKGPRARLRLVVDRLDVFAALEPRIAPDRPRQTLDGLEIWSEAAWEAACAAEGIPGPPVDAALETFSQGLKPAFAARFLDPQDRRPRVWLNVEYLSAEAYAAEYHKLPGLCPAPAVRRRWWFPGFVPGTGGLLRGPAFSALQERYERDPAARTRDRAAWAQRRGAPGPMPDPAARWLSVFSYERDYGPFVRSLLAQPAPTVLWVFDHRGRADLEAALTAAGWPGQPGPWGQLFVAPLPFLPQAEYDRLILLADGHIVRGEESLVRGALSGRPFVWHSYLQDEGYQRVKAEALWALMRPDFETAAPAEGEPRLAAAFEDLWRAFNERLTDGRREEGSHRPATAPETEEAAWSALWRLWPAWERAAGAYARRLRSLPEMGGALLDYLYEIL